MRRKDREIVDSAKINDIIHACHCCRLGLHNDGEVYIVPMNFGFTEQQGARIFYFHCALEGRKLDLMRKTPVVGFELDTGFSLVAGESACAYSARYQSVIGTGEITFLSKPDQKRTGLRTIMRHYTAKDDWDFSEAALKSVCVFQLRVLNLSCKEHL